MTTAESITPTKTGHQRQCSNTDNNKGAAYGYESPDHQPFCSTSRNTLPTDNTVGDAQTFGNKLLKKIDEEEDPFSEND